MSSGFFNIGVSGLNVAQIGLMTTGNNIANASTPGFNRQYIEQSPRTPVFSGSGFLGTGANVDSVRRVYNEFLAAQVRTAETNVSELETYGNLISQIDNLLADPGAGVSPVLQGFFAAISDLASTPNSIPARQAMLSAAQALTARFQALDQQFSVMRDGVNSQIVTQVTTINSMVKQVAEINQRIILAQAAGPGQPANDLHDQRDFLVSELNKEIRVTIQKESDGSYSLFFGSGQPLLVGAQIFELKGQPSREDLAHLEVALQAPNGDMISLPESLIGGGKLGGLLRFRSQTLDQAQNSLGRVAMAVATTVNEQHKLGQDLQGVPGGNFFRPIQPYVIGAPVNLGTAQVSAKVLESDYRLEFDGAQFNLVRLSDNRVSSHESLPINVDGITLSLGGGMLAGTPAKPDVFLVRPSAPPAERVVGLSGNIGSATVNTTGSNLQTLVTSDYRLTLIGNGQLTLMRLSDGHTWSGAGPTQQDAIKDLMQQASPLGFEISAVGTMTINDSFLIRPIRYAARDLSLAIGDPRSIAAAMGMTTGAAPQNGGTGQISVGSVEQTNVPLAAPVLLTYESSSSSLIGFPVGSTVMVGLTKHLVTSTTQRIPYSAGATISFGGLAFNLNATPANGQTFIIDPRAAVGMQGFATPNGFADGLGSFDNTRWVRADWSNGGVFANAWSPGQIAFDGSQMTITLDEVSGSLVSGEYRSVDTYGHGYYEVNLMASNVPGTITGFFTYTGPAEGTPHDEIDIEIKGDESYQDAGELLGQRNRASGGD